MIRAPMLVPAAMALLLAGCSGAELELEPAVLSGCHTGAGKVIHVTWDARRASTGSVRIELARPGGPTRLWTGGAPQGSRDTGPWGSDGLTFVLLAGDGRELARRTIETSPCPADAAAAKARK